jgi:hypothetical protein
VVEVDHSSEDYNGRRATQSRIDVTFDIERHFHLAGRLTAFIVVAPGYRFTAVRPQSSSAAPYDQVQWRLSAGVGVEYRIAPSLTLGISHQLAFTYDANNHPSYTYIDRRMTTRPSSISLTFYL